MFNYLGLQWDKAGSQVMNKDDIIKNLNQHNKRLEQEVEYWKKEYWRVESMYQTLRNNQGQHLSNNNKISQDLFEVDFSQPLINIREQDTLIMEIDNPITTTSSSFKDQLANKIPKQEIQETPGQSQRTKFKTSDQSKDLFDFFDQKIHQVPHLDKFTCELIQGCFIIQKNSSIDHFDPVKLAYPQNKYLKLRSMFDIIYRYVFVNDDLVEIHDDQFDSRKNQILFGTPSEDFMFVFDNLSQKEGEKGRLNMFERQTYLMRKRYAYGIVMPEIVKVGNQFFQTELAFGFLSHLPFGNFFKDLNRIVQQQIKYYLLNANKESLAKEQKIDLLGDIITNIVTKSLEKKLIVLNYPINLQLRANICGLKLVYTHKNNFISDQFSNIELIIHKYSLLKIIKILHYVLSEQHIILVCKNRKNLNQLFQIIRILLYPFNWIFPIIYFYSPFFQPFLSSPLPIMIGHLDRTTKEEEDDRNSFKKLSLPEHELITIYAEDENAQDYNEPEDYSKRIKRLYKKIAKKIKNDKPLSSLIEKSPQEKITNQIFIYIKKLRDFVDTGKTEDQLDQFLINFMETQMVQYYKENKKELQATK